MLIIDAHAHVFPDKIAAHASKGIQDFYQMRTRYDGTVSKLLELGDAAGISRFLIQSVATTPAQVTRINTFIAGTVAAQPQRFVGFATLHPDMKNPEAELERALALGLSGVKLHPDFQQFPINDRRAFPIYAACEHTCPILLHTGDSRFAFSHPRLVPEVLRAFPALKLVCAHFGGWSEWDEAESYLAGTGVWVDTSSTLYTLPDEKVRELIAAFGEDRVIFGSDYPMWNPGVELQRIQNLRLTPALQDRILYRNLCDLLNIEPPGEAANK